MTFSGKTFIVMAVAAVFAGSAALAAPSDALTRFVAQAAASSVSPLAGTTTTTTLARTSDSTEGVTEPTSSAVVSPNVVQLPITIRPPFRPIIRSPFTP